MTLVPLLKLTRFPLVFTAIADSAAGYLLSLGGRRVSPTVLAVLALTSACLYACGMVLNDVADAERDRERHPERPIPSGRVSKRHAAAFGIGLAVAAIAISGSILPMLALGALVTWLVILAYDFVTKEHGGAGAATMGLARFCNFSLGILAAGSGNLELFPDGPWREAAVVGVYVFFLTRVSQTEEGRGGSASIGAWGMLIAIAAAWWRSPERLPWATASAGLLAALVLALMIRTWIRPGREAIMTLVLWGVIGIILLDATLLLGRGALVPGLAVAGLLVPVLVSRPLFRHL